MAEVYSVPAMVLDLLGGLREEDPAVMLAQMWGSKIDRVVPWHPSQTEGEDLPEPGPEDRLILPASDAALAAVVARHVGLDPSRGVLWDLVTRAILAAGPIIAVELTIRTPRDLKTFCWRTPARHQVLVPPLAGITDPTFALAVVACWLAEAAGKLKHGSLGVDRG